MSRFRVLGLLVVAVVMTQLMALMAHPAAAWSDPNTAPVSVLGGFDTTILAPKGVTTDGQGRIFIANTRQNSVLLFDRSASGNSSPLKVLQGDQTQLINPQAIALDAQGRTYVVNDNSVTVYAADWPSGNTAPVKLLRGANTGLMSPTAVAFDSANRMYVTNSYEAIGRGGTVTVYAPEWKSGDTFPIATLEGPRSRLDRPVSLAFDNKGLLYVVNKETITVYSPGVIAGDAPPIGLLNGLESGLRSPRSIAFDDTGFMYVVSASSRVTVHGPGWPTYFGDGRYNGLLSSLLSGEALKDFRRWLVGEIEPTAILEGGNAQLERPYGIAVDPFGRVHVTNEGSNNVATFIPRLQAIETSFPASLSFDQSTFQLTAEASSGLPTSIASLTPTICSAEGTDSVTVVVLDVGPCLISASRDGNYLWARAPRTISLTLISAGPQTITFPSPGPQLLSATRVRLEGRASSGLPVIWASTTPSVCREAGAFGQILALRSAGTCRVTATQPGNRQWNQATPVTVEFPVTSRPSVQILANCVKSQAKAIRCSGTTVNVPAGASLKVFTRINASASWVEVPVASRPQVDAGGAFTWTYLAGNSRRVTVYFEFEGVTSRQVNVSMN